MSEFTVEFTFVVDPGNDDPVEAAHMAMDLFNAGGSVVAVVVDENGDEHEVRVGTNPAGGDG